jgi:hypothetical protein
MERPFLQQIIRAVLALSQLAVRCDADDVRSDLTDEVAALVDIVISTPSGERLTDSLTTWCRRTGDWLQRLRSVPDIDQPALLRAQEKILRLLASADVRPPQKSVARRVAVPRPTAGDEEPNSTQGRVLAWLRENPGMRTRALVANFSGEFSDRTVKRSLTKLVGLGLVARRESEDGGVRYEAVER